MTQQREQDRLQVTLMVLSERMRHPDLPLSVFRDPVDTHASDDDDVSTWSDGELRRARMRRGAVLAAAHRIVDECIDDLRNIGFPDAGAPDGDEAAESFVHRFFPTRFRHDYDEAFFRKVLVTAVKVAQDLADPDGGAAACTAEAIIRAALPATAQAVCERAGITGVNAGVLDGCLLEDIDFERLFADEIRGVEDDPRLDGTANLFDEGAHDWFTPFAETALVHPYTEPTAVRRRVHDLRYRLPSVSGPPRRLDRELDAPEPVVAFGAGSAAVAAARTAADRSDPELWVPDDTNTDTSFRALLAAVSRAPSGSGWLTWQPFEDDDTIRTDMLMRATPYPHFPVGPDEPWIDAAVAKAALLAIPLRYVVSYRPDPELRSHVEPETPFPLIPLPPQGPTSGS